MLTDTYTVSRLLIEMDAADDPNAAVRAAGAVALDARVDAARAGVDAQLDRVRAFDPVLAMRLSDGITDLLARITDEAALLGWALAVTTPHDVADLDAWPAAALARAGLEEGAPGRAGA